MPDLGKIAYEAYCKSAGGVSLINGGKLPPWDVLSDPIRVAWDAAAQAVARCFRPECSEDLPDVSDPNPNRVEDKS